MVIVKPSGPPIQSTAVCAEGTPLWRTSDLVWVRIAVAPHPMDFRE